MLASHLGRDADGRVHVILSRRATHERRFPPRANNLLSLLNQGDADELAADRRGADVAADDAYPRRYYAHGVATRIRGAHAAPKGATLGERAIYLDVETIEGLAEEFEVSDQGMMAAVAIHELSHVVRDHADDEDSAAHGWFSEGDAQRDAWYVLTEMLSHEQWLTPARFGRIGQVRAADKQPAAYQHFGATPTERSSLGRHRAVLPIRSWTIRPQPEVWRLTHERYVETPLRTRWLFGPTSRCVGVALAQVAVGGSRSCLVGGAPGRISSSPAAACGCASMSSASGSVTVLGHVCLRQPR